MKRRLLASLLTLVMVLSLLPTAVLAKETSGQEGEESTSQTVKDIYDNEWTFTTSESGNNIEMTQGDNSITATLDNEVLTFSGTGTMPVLNDSTDSVSGSVVAAYPWAGWSSSVTKIVIADGIMSVGAKSFITWPKVTAVELGKDVETIGAGAFAQLTACTQFTVDTSNTSFEAVDGVLYSKGLAKLYYYPCAKSDVTDFTVPDSVTELGYNAICRNTSLQTISFAGDNVLHFGFGSMFGNTALTTVNLGRPDVTFDTLVFNHDTALKVVYCKTPEVKAAANNLMKDTGSNTVALLQGGQYDKTSEDYNYAIDSEGAIICGYKGTATELTIPNELDGEPVTGIAVNAFANLDGNRKITEVTIPASVKVIAPNAFLGNSNSNKTDTLLTNVTILGTDIEIGSMAFARHQDLRIDMKAVKNLNADNYAFSSVAKIIVARDSQEALRTALAKNDSIAAKTKVYVDTDSDNDSYWNYKDGKWVSNGSVTLTDEQGLQYTVNYTTVGATMTATAEIKGYEKQDTAVTELVIPKTLPFTDASGNEAQATVVSISRLRGYSDKPANNGIKTLTVKADLPSLNTTFVYWNDLETVNILGNVASLVNCFTGCSALKQVYFGDQENITFGSSAFGNVPHLGVIDLSNVKTVIMTSTPGYSNAITNFYSNTSGNVTMVYVGSEAVYQAINEVTVAGETKSGFDFTNKRNIVVITNGGTFENPPTNNTTLATPSKEGYKFIGWYKDADFKTPLGDEAPVAGQTYYAKYGKSAELSTDIADKTFVVGADPVEFTISSMANADKDTKVRSYFTLVDANGNDAKSAIDTLDYLETSVSPNAWVDLKQFNFVFGPAAGYPLTDNAESHFRVTFNKAGTYTLTVSCKDVDNNNVVCSKTVTITVDPKSIAVPAADGTQFVYTGSAQTYNIAADAAYTVTGNVQTDAGTYTVTVSLKDKANTVWAGGTTADKEYTFTIAKAAGSVTAPTAKELTYTGEAQELVDAGSSDTGTIQYRLDNGEYSENVPMATSAGTYTVYYKVIGDANHNDVAEESITVTIAKAGQDKPAAPTLRDRSYTSITLNEVAGAEYSKDGGKTWQSPPEFTGLTSGTTYEFVIRYAATDNYNASPASDAVKFTTRRHSSATVTPTPTPEPEPTPDNSSKFADVPANAYFADAVKWAVDKGITNGLSDTMFGPYESCTRAQIVTFLWRAAGSPEPKAMSSFTDVPANAYYAKAVAWAVENGITNGMTETTFAPNATCTRGQSVTFLYRALKGTASGSTNFTDVKSDAFYADAINWAVANNVTNGTSNTTFSPNADCTRAEIVTFLYRAYQGK